MTGRSDRSLNFVRRHALGSEAVLKHLPGAERVVGSALIQVRNLFDRTDVQVTTNCAPASKTNAVTPSANGTSLESSIVASVEPSATVTTRSKAFIFESVRLPVRRGRKMSRT